LDKDNQNKVEQIAYKMQLSHFEYELKWKRTNPIEFEKDKTEWLNDKDLENIKQSVYENALQAVKRLPYKQIISTLNNKEFDWVKTKDKNDIMNETTLVLKYAKGEELFDCLNKILSGQFILNDKPTHFTDTDWDIIMLLQSKVLELRKNDNNANK
jgi:hypothetical protein